MPQFTSFTLADGQATPANHTFSPVSMKDGLAVWSDRAVSTFTLQPKITAKFTSSAKATGVNRISLPIAVPYNDAINGLRVARLNIEFLIPNDCPASVRADLHAYAKNLISHADFKKCVTDVEAFW